MHRRPRIIGYRKNGAPIWEIMGGGPENDDAGDTGDQGDEADADADDQSDDGDGSTGAGDGDGDQGDDGDDSTDWKAEAARWKRLSQQGEKRGKKLTRAAERARDEALAEVQRLKNGGAKTGDTSGRDDAGDAGDTSSRADADKKINRRILRSEIKAAAKGVLQDPSDAFLHLNLDDFDVSDDGDVDESEIATALEDLIARKPYLAAQGGRRFQGSNNGGPRNASSQRQLTDADLERMKPAEIEKARIEGRLDRLLGKKK